MTGIKMLEANPNYDPVTFHERLMRGVQQEYSYKGGDFCIWQERLRVKLREILGLDRMPLNPPPLAIRRHWKRQSTHGTIERISFTSEEGYEIPAYLCLPEPQPRPCPAFVCLQGHSTGMHNSIAVAFGNEDEPIKVEGDRDFGLSALRYGVAALCIEQRAFGECKDGRASGWAGCHNPAMQALLLGRTLLGERIYDVDRAIDVLYTLPEIDRTRIGVMGNSGGGTVSMFAGGLLPRLTHVMPSCSFSTFRDSIMSINHCLCNYVPGLLCYAEAAEVLALGAPKPLVVVNGQIDEIFPIAAARAEFSRLRELYEKAGGGDKCIHVIGDGGHRFYADGAWPVMCGML